MDHLAPGPLDDADRPLYRHPLVLLGVAWVAFAFLAPAIVDGFSRAEDQASADLDRAQAEYAAQQAVGYSTDLPPDDSPLAQQMGMEPVYDHIRLQRALDRTERREGTRVTAQAAERPRAPRIREGWTYGDVMSAAGAPDRLVEGGGTETWEFYPTQGRSWRLTIEFREGRVVSADPPASPRQ